MKLNTKNEMFVLIFPAFINDRNEGLDRNKLKMLPGVADIKVLYSLKHVFIYSFG